MVNETPYLTNQSFALQNHCGLHEHFVIVRTTVTRNSRGKLFLRREVQIDCNNFTQQPFRIKVVLFRVSDFEFSAFRTDQLDQKVVQQ